MSGNDHRRSDGGNPGAGIGGLPGPGRHGSPGGRAGGLKRLPGGSCGLGEGLGLGAGRGASCLTYPMGSVFEIASLFKNRGFCGGGGVLITRESLSGFAIR